MSEPCTKEKEIAKVSESTKSAHHRIDELKERVERQEENSKILIEMNKNIGSIATQIEGQEKTIEEMKVDVKELTIKPTRKWDSAITSIITALITALTTALVVGALK